LPRNSGGREARQPESESEAHEKARRWAATQTGQETEAEMSIPPIPHVTNSLPRDQHDPELCGLDIDGKTLCPGCRAVDQERPRLTDLSPVEQERYLRTLGQPWRDHLRRQHDLPDPLTAAERNRFLRDLECYPERWQPILLAILSGPIAEIAAAVAKEVHRGRAA
jgi:hypothetical protein